MQVTKPNLFTQTFLFYLTFIFSITINAQSDKIPPSNNPANKILAPEPELKPYFLKTDHTQTNWYLEMQKEQPNVILAEKHFEEYFCNNPLERSRQYKLFLRWLTLCKINVDENGFLKNEPIKNYKDLGCSNAPNAARTSPGSWRMIGPNYHKRDACGGLSTKMSGGYVDRVYINPYNTNNMYAGYSYGGLWVSQDEGATWSLSDAEFPNGTNGYANNDRYYGDIKACAANPSTVYVAAEAGLLKSTDAGASWNYCAELNRTVDINKRPYFMAVSPNDPNLLLSTFGKKVFRSTDGGNTWTLAFDNTNGGSERYFTNQHSTSSYGLHSRTYNFFGLEIDFSNPNIFYLGATNAANEPCIYKSTDGGISFNFLINLNIVNARTMPTHLKLQTIGASGGKFFIYPEWQTNDVIYTYDTNGNLLQQNTLSVQSEAGDLSFTDENVFYNGHYFSSSIYKSGDRGATFEDMMDGTYGGCVDGNKYVHVDIRAIDVVGDFVLIGNDGGLTLSKDGMFSAYTTGYEISAIDLWGFGSSHRSDICVAGLDHGPSSIRKYDGDEGWHDRGGGDAIHCSVNQAHDKWVYYDTQYGVFKEYVHPDGTLSGRTGLDLPFNVDRLEFHPNIFTVAYGISSNVLYRTDDHFSSTEVVYTFDKNIRRVRASKENAALLYVLLSNLEIKKSTDSGQTWVDVTPVEQSNFIDIALGAGNEVFALLGNSGTTNKIFQSTDGGNTWINRTTPNLPATAPSEIAYQMGTDGGVYMAFAGMHGVWYRNNNMAQWEQLGNGLPMFAYIKNIFTVPNKGKYRMGSSRGSWEHDLYESAAPIANFSVENNKVTCPDQLVTYIDNSTAAPGNLTYAWSFPGGSPATSAAASPGVSYAVPGVYNVSLTITDGNGQSHTRTLTNFIEVTNSCGENQWLDYVDNLNCGNTIPESAWLNSGEEVLIKDFTTESGDEFFVNLNTFTNCYNTTATLRAIVNANHNTINTITYKHFNQSNISPVYGNATDSIASHGTDYAQIAFVVRAGKLYLKSVSNACGGVTRLNASCWADLCGNTIPQSAWITGGTEILVKDFATETGQTFHVNLKSYVNCYATTANLTALINIPNQEIKVENYYHFGASSSGGINGDGTNTVTSTSASFGKISYRLDGTSLYFTLISQACGGSGRLSASCFLGVSCQAATNDPCDDGDACTANDVYDANCNCAGISQDSDGDGICDAEDDTNGNCTLNASCDDGDACTTNDVYDANCICLGAFADNDGDGICDAEDSCANGIPQSGWLNGGEELLVKDFTTENEEEFYVELNSYTNCYGTTATLKASVNVTNSTIQVMEYTHFSSTAINDPISGNGTTTVTAASASYAQIAFDLRGEALYFQLISNACGAVNRLNNSCWSPYTICVEEMEENGVIASGTYHAVTSISAIGTAETGTVVNFKAGDYILMNAGFEVELGCEFSVEIETCQ